MKITHQGLNRFTRHVCFVTLLCCLSLDIGLVQAYVDKDVDIEFLKEKIPPGRYHPILHGGHRGKYVHDDSGRYIHIHIPYNGGYGDRGLRYIHDIRGNIIKRPPNARALFPLGPDDHVRFTLDFNYNGTGWQIVTFDWTRDGDPDHKYKFESATRLWEVIDENDEEYANYELGSGNNFEEEESDSTDYAEDGGYDYSVKNSDNPSRSSEMLNDLQKALIEILGYVAKNVIPTI